MPDPKDTPEGEHIEELLSQLKGIFGHLSDSEKEESKQKVTPPVAPTPPPVTPAAPPAPETPAASAPEMPTPEHPLTMEEMAPLDPMLAPFELPADAGPAPVEDIPVPAVESAPDIQVPEGASLVPAIVFYPAGRMNEAKAVSERIEKITPKFTKVAVVIHVKTMVTFDSKGDIKSVILSQLAPSIRAVFLLIDKPLDDARRKALIAELEPKGMYFQEIPFHQIEKKALYTDMLLGMVFFFDSQKKPGEGAS